ncbi:hypothetical protein GFK26_23975 [Variovorax paradoxus]|uniref:Uncharacterized protein n=1 Tax=Variovorax paradoxus TaxID=34073 RepID=A0A5Q0M7Y6_VARPD|nr:hypothetical protein [Variovorax paradoxus]QFZ85606.1 hypothetical protein GFK26_23975 [Variovorax paradoxus]
MIYFILKFTTWRLSKFFELISFFGAPVMNLFFLKKLWKLLRGKPQSAHQAAPGSTLFGALVVASEPAHGDTRSRES